jgi:uncharacterized protein (TIGR02271 family)
MTNYTSGEVAGWVGRTAVDPSGDKIGKVEAIYEDDNGSGPEWFAIRTGMFGSHRSFVPVRGATTAGDELRVAYDKGLIKDAPRIDDDGHMSQEEEDRLYQHYGMDWGYDQTATTAAPAPRTTVDTTQTNTRTGRNDDAMTRSEEELDVQTRTREAGRARLRKWVETEQVNVTVPVRREVARVVTEPVTDANINKAMGGPEITENEYDVTLTEEEVVVDKTVVPKERVRLDKDIVQEERQVTEELRKERIDFDADTERRP